MINIAELPKYDVYKDSGNEWLGVIPKDWAFKKFKYLARVKKGKIPKRIVSVDSFNLPPYLSMDYLRGTDAKQFVDDRSAVLVEDGAILLLWDGSNAGEFVLGKWGVVSSTLAHVDFFSVNKKFAWYACQLTEMELRSTTVGMGIPHVDGEQLKNSILAIPSPNEQVLIANFLHKKTTQIDDAIAIKEQQISLLKERKQIIIQQAVTQGLDPNVPMKDSGVDWIGKIPDHWEVRRAKYIFDEVDERSKNGDEELLSVSHMTGVTPRSEKNVSMFMAEDYTGSKLCIENDLVINIMWAWMGALGVSDRVGIVSPSYGVFRQKLKNTFNPTYLEYLLKSVKYVEYYNKVSTGLHSSRLRFYGHMLFAMKMGYPSYEEQNEIMAYLHEQTKRIDLAIDSQLAQIEKLKEYKTTLINSAVTGKIKITPEMVEQ
ncbi:restriction endonuclease subunit S [Vibrio parahaemolyticus]|uniref:restriction endonuclease subunit S n=1 Tax=Vibrio parahaemolyticus TaxID=670 RepID=UPI00326040CC|nr:restriction endonuclease subunit S [Vibrio parahaemolyticus]HCE1954556.1 restriction endonuclease subunit S [Vibrio parahaemolyticus]HCE2048363.1 restriction endonuclease subunit S [Vibrio parahaemolyticus]HCE2404518.1 restriction endonuclease subunit S [Vibrio parahaemolyticus]HCE3082846.1 restriction endonuclease subunit S [Vibrio parahaemolyticus]